MKINKILLYNFNSFEGENEFDFTNKEDKNIILIGGKNGAGKNPSLSQVKTIGSGTCQGIQKEQLAERITDGIRQSWFKRS